MPVIVCYSKCWACMFGRHARQVHTWMDADDLEHRHRATPTTLAGWVALGRTDPCSCWCTTYIPAPVRASADRTRSNRARAGSRRNRRLRNVPTFRSDQGWM